MNGKRLSGRIVVAFLFALALSLGSLGCRHLGEHPSREHPGKAKAGAEHPAKAPAEHPAKAPAEHPAKAPAEHPSTEHPK